MYRKIIPLATILFSSIISCNKHNQDPSVITIGFIGNLSGKYVTYPSHMLNAAKLAVQEKNSAGGINGKKIRLIAEDDEGSITDTAKYAERIFSLKPQALIIAGPPYTALSLTQRTESEKLPTLCPAQSLRDLPNKGDYTIALYPDKTLHAKIAAHYFYKALGCRRAAILTVKDDTSQMLSRAFHEEFKKYSGKIVCNPTIQNNEKNILPQLSSVKENKADCLYIPHESNTVSLVCDQKSYLPNRIKIITTLSPHAPASSLPSENKYKDILFTISESETSASQIFTESYFAAYKKKPSEFDVYAYDALKLIFFSLEQSTEPMTGTQLRKAITDTRDFPGASGKLSFTLRDNRIINVGIYPHVSKSIHPLKNFQLDDKEAVVERKL